jgi:triosephosphate isomerase
MRAPLIIGNWKANPASYKDARILVALCEKKIKQGKKVVHGYAVPEIYYGGLSEEFPSLIGLQHCSGVALGAFTGTTVPSMLASINVPFCIVGHSEVRARGETDETIKEKTFALLKSGVTTILCVGEEKRDREGKYLVDIEAQLQAVIPHIKEALIKRLVIAYEPVWAVNASVSATPEECFEVMIAIRRTLAKMVGLDYAKKVKVLYGGTTNKENALSFVQEGGADGLLVGRASLDAEHFASIINLFHA